MFSTNFAKILTCFLNFFFISTRGINVVQKDKVILIQTEEALRNVTSKLFSALNFSKNSLKSSQTVLIINYFTNITLMSQQELNIVTILSKVDNRTKLSNIDIDEILNDDNYTKIHFENISSSTEKALEEMILYLNISKKPGGLYDFVKMDEKVKRILNTSYFENRFLKSVESFEGNYSLNFVNKNWVHQHQQPSPERRIYKGHKIQPMQFPYLASIHIFHDNFKCAGSIIKSDLIITAASCLHVAWENEVFRNDPSFISVRVGSDHYNKGGEVIRASEINFHPGYNPKNLSNNIAVIRLVRRMLFQAQNLKKIAYDTNHGPMYSPYVTIAGWGSKGPRHGYGENMPTELTYDELSVYTMKECRDIYTSAYISKKNFCAGYVERGSGACNHDVGGPGVVNGVLTGIISFGPQVCGTPDAPTVFTKIGYYSSWIDVIVTQGVSNVRTAAPSEEHSLRESKNPIKLIQHVPPAIFVYSEEPTNLKHEPETTWHVPKKELQKNSKPTMHWLEWMTMPSHDKSPWMTTWYNPPNTTMPPWTQSLHPPELLLKWFNYSKIIPTRVPKPFYTKLNTNGEKEYSTPLFYYSTKNSNGEKEYTIPLFFYSTKNTNGKKGYTTRLFYYSAKNTNGEKEYTTPLFYYSTKKEQPKKFWYYEDTKKPTISSFQYDPYAKNAKGDSTKLPSPKHNKEVFQDISSMLKKFMNYIINK